MHLIAILEAVATPFKQISAEPRDPQHKFCRVTKDQEECEDLLVGSAFKQLARHGLMPIPRAEDCQESMKSLTDQVKSLKLTRLTVHGDAPHQSHEGCSLGFNPAIEEILTALPNFLTDKHQEHIRQQGIATGLATSAEDADVGVPAENAEPKRTTRYDTWTNKNGTPSITSSSD